MVFSSLKFIFIFLPLFLLSYFLVEEKYKNLCILLYSLLFYFYGVIETPSYLIVLIISLLFNYSIALFIEYHKIKQNIISKNIFTIIALSFNILTLFVFKYYDFFIDILNYFNGESNLAKINLILPIGISFYTFQIISYIVDVSVGTIVAEKSFINLATYIVMFPQLIAGPIVRFNDVRNEINASRDFNKYNFIDGIRIFILGLSAKVIIANQLAKVKLDMDMLGANNLSSETYWLGAFSYAFQLYFDFFGYSLMAIGLAKIIGITIKKNFDRPYSSKSISEFWRRWHISLSTFLRDYVYIYLGGSRRGLFFTCINLFIVFLLSGLWHGANVNFVIWGAYLGLFVVIERIIRYFIKKYNLDNSFIINNKFNNIVKHIYVIIVMVISFVIFSHEDIAELKNYLSQMFSLSTFFINDSFVKILNTNFKAIVLAFLFITSIPNMIYNKIKFNKKIHIVILLFIFILDIYLIFIGTNDPFMYFRF